MRDQLEYYSTRNQCRLIDRVVDPTVDRFENSRSSLTRNVVIHVQIIRVPRKIIGSGHRPSDLLAGQPEENAYDLSGEASHATYIGRIQIPIQSRLLD